MNGAGGSYHGWVVRQGTGSNGSVLTAPLKVSPRLVYFAGG